MNHNKIMEFVLLWALVLSGCASPAINPGDAIPIMPGATQYGLHQAMSGAQTVAKALTNGKDAIVAWPGPGSCWSCLVFERGSVPSNGTQAQAMNPQDMSGLMKWLVTVLGWARIGATELTPAVMPVMPEMFPKGAPKT